MSAHKCQPAEKVDPCFYSCATCGKEIEPVKWCFLCDGEGCLPEGMDGGGQCRDCDGTGVVQWRPVKEAKP